MKRFFWLASCVMVLVAMTKGFAFAAGGITDKEIQQGLDFCKAYPIQMIVNGQAVVFEAKDVPPVVITPSGEQNGRTLVPARAMFEAMGATVGWEEATQTVTVTLDDKIVHLVIGSDKARVNWVETALEVPPLIIDHDKDSFGSTMIPVRFTAEALGGKVEWDELTRTAKVVYERKIEEETPTNGGIETTPPAVTPPTGGTVPGIPSGGYATAYLPQYDMSVLPVMNEVAAKKLIVVDMGHGGKDSGTIAYENTSKQIYEKDVNLPVGLKLKELLEAAGANVYFIRETDVYYTLLERADAANMRNATLFISIHNNSNESASPKGTEVHYNSKKDAAGNDEKSLYGIASKDVAQKVQKEMLKAMGTYDRGIKESPKLAVLNKTYMPAILIEGAFMSNAEDYERISNPDYANRYAYALAKSVIEAMNEAYN